MGKLTPGKMAALRSVARAYDGLARDQVGSKNRMFQEMKDEGLITELPISTSLGGPFYRWFVTDVGRSALSNPRGDT